MDLNQAVTLPEFDNINVSYGPNEEVILDWEKYARITSAVYLFCIIVATGILCFVAFLFSALLVGIFSAFNIFEEHDAIIGNFVFAIVSIIVLIRITIPLINYLIPFYKTTTVSIYKDKVSSHYMTIGINEISKIEYDLEIDEDVDFFSCCFISLLDSSDEPIFFMVASIEDSKKLIPFFEILLNIGSEENIDQPEDPKLIEKNKRREKYEDWDSKSFMVWWSDYLFKFIPRTILFFGLIGLIFYGIGNWLN